MRIVLDTNVVLSALLWRGTPYQLLATLHQRSNVQLYSSTALIEELTDVLSRDAATKRLALIGRSARDVLSDYIAAIEIVEPVIVPQVILADADDDHVLAAAVTARADMIVSGDRKHLLPLGSHQGIAIVDAAEATKRIIGR